MTSLARLRALADLDLEIVGRVREKRRDAEATGGDLLAAIARVAADEIGELAALALAIASAYARYAVSPCDPKDIDEM